MIAVVQRCQEASVQVDAIQVGAIGKGYLVLLGVETGDADDDLAWLADKIAVLRLFPDAQGKMNLDVREAGGGILCVSQFTLLADCAKGRRPGFQRSEDPARAKEMWERFCERLAHTGLAVERGVFAADMKVALINDGPVTIVLDSRRRL
ncbi:MAG TPA: D-aminoacyl-tRNA deacylase [Fibrobacteria bacterium]|nr:D-aminoacyl-tRNA deacylase [Fibrobacteria bacterium]HOX52584.1 D-aminoacyl-tRNA deacylase [Fibrobacteria bacterium]